MLFNKKGREEAEQANLKYPGVGDVPLDSKYTPNRITQIGDKDIFVFGSNLAGRQGGGAARIALNQFGAKYGQGEGLQGNAYAIPTMQGGVETIRPYVEKFIDFAKNEPTLTFYVTKIGCGIAGFKTDEIAPLFRDALSVSNIRLPKDFVDFLTRPKQEVEYEDLMTHVHGVTRTFADLIMEQNKTQRFQRPEEVMAYLTQYFDRFRQSGDDVAFIAVRMLWNLLHSDRMFVDGQLDLKSFKEALTEHHAYSRELDKAYEFHCREKLYNLVVYLNQFRRYRYADEVLRDIQHSEITKFSHCGPNCDYMMSPVRAGHGYPIFYFERFLNENWEKITNASGILDNNRLDELMFRRHERGIRKYGLDAVIKHDYNLYACWGAYQPKKVGTGPVYIELDKGGYAISCGEGAGPNHIPHYLEYTIASEMRLCQNRRSLFFITC